MSPREPRNALNGFDDLSPDVEREDGPNLRVLLVRGVVRSFPWVCLIVLLGAGVGLGIGLMTPNQYASEAKLLLRAGAREQITSESLFGPEGQRVPPPTMVDELQMLADAGLYERVAREIGPREILAPADPRRDDGI